MNISFNPQQNFLQKNNLARNVQKQQLGFSGRFSNVVEHVVKDSDVISIRATEKGAITKAENDHQILDDALKLLEGKKPILQRDGKFRKEISSTDMKLEAYNGTPVGTRDVVVKRWNIDDFSVGVSEVKAGENTDEKRFILSWHDFEPKNTDKSVLDRLKALFPKREK